MITPVTDHVEQGLGKLISRYKRRRRFAAWVASSIRQFQEIEDAAWTVINSRDVDTCDAPRLELLGKVVGQKRRGESLERFRLYVKARIAVNKSSGRIADVLRAARLLLGGAGSVTIRFGSPMFFRIDKVEPLDPVTTDPVVVAELIREATSAGVGSALVYSLSPAATRFTFSNLTTNPSTHTFGSTTSGGAGGKLSAVA